VGRRQTAAHDEHPPPLEDRARRQPAVGQLVRVDDPPLQRPLCIPAPNSTHYTKVIPRPVSRDYWYPPTCSTISHGASLPVRPGPVGDAGHGRAGAADDAGGPDVRPVLQVDQMALTLGAERRDAHGPPLHQPLLQAVLLDHLTRNGGEGRVAVGLTGGGGPWKRGRVGGEVKLC
jgi:hypothetical protein